MIVGSNCSMKPNSLLISLFLLRLLCLFFLFLLELCESLLLIIDDDPRRSMFHSPRVPAMIIQHIGRGAHNASLGVTHLTRAAVIQRVPLFIVQVLGVGRVMSAAHSAHVIAHGVQIINGILLLFLAQQKRRHIQALNGEFHQRIDAVPPIPSIAKALQMDNQQIGRTPQIDLLTRALKALTV